MSERGSGGTIREKPSTDADRDPDISVVIPTWNGRATIESALESLATQTLVPARFEIVVVDDGSTDGTGALARSFADHHPELAVACVSQPNGGVNAARNTGVKLSAGRYVSFLDDDEIAPPDLLERVVDRLDRSSALPGVGGPVRDSGGSGLRVCATCKVGDASVVADPAGWTRRLLGGNMTIRREVFEEVGLFDAEISGRGDETEWFQRADRDFLYDERLVILHRRDHMRLRDLLASGFRQGRAVPIAAAKSGTGPWRPSAMRLVRYTAHGLGRRCSQGLLQTSRELGSLATWVRRGVGAVRKRVIG